MSDTPRTDAVQYELLNQDTYTSWLEMSQTARQLERELNAANESFRKLNIHTLNLVDRIRRLEDAGDALKAAGYFGGFGDAVNKWNKAKEAKL